MGDTRLCVNVFSLLLTANYEKSAAILSRHCSRPAFDRSRACSDA